jgi:hypothetical protein
VHFGVHGITASAGGLSRETFRPSEMPDVGIGPLVERRLQVQLPASSEDLPLPSVSPRSTSGTFRSTAWPQGETALVTARSLRPPALAPPLRLS